jgi:hypothetical protein
VGRASVITQEATHTKKVIFHPGMMPKVTICDPQLTVGMPPKITAGTGMDAFAHCLEAYCATYYHPMADGIAVEGHVVIEPEVCVVIVLSRLCPSQSHAPAPKEVAGACDDVRMRKLRSNSFTRPIRAPIIDEKGVYDGLLSHPARSSLETSETSKRKVAPVVAGHQRGNSKPI